MGPHYGRFSPGLLKMGALARFCQDSTVSYMPKFKISYLTLQIGLVFSSFRGMLKKYYGLVED